MKFLNRVRESAKITSALKDTKSKLIILYGRRRCGKSTLLQHTVGKKDIYFAADMQEAHLQRVSFAKEIGKIVDGFEHAVYPDWDSLFNSFQNSIPGKLIVCIDEFPYLIRMSPELPSVLQKIIDLKKNSNYHIILCGSSQQMMQGMVLDGASPLYGRADEILHIKPLPVYWLKEALKCTAAKAVEEYSVLGGVPRYWDLRMTKKNLREAMSMLILDPFGILYEEPMRLFLDDMRSSVQPYSLLTLIAGGSNRLSEIAGRLEKPATQLARPLQNLIDLNYVKREIPFGENLKSTKRSLYKIADPFINFYFKFVVPNRSRLEIGIMNPVVEEIERRLPEVTGNIYEDLARQAIPFLSIMNQFGEGKRWWGSCKNGKQAELDVVAASLDNKMILAGEVKWSNRISYENIYAELNNRISDIQFFSGKKIIKAVFVKNKKIKEYKDMLIFDAGDVVEVLK